jgi:quercetin dioxygenase-like cupin family protein
MCLETGSARSRPDACLDSCYHTGMVSVLRGGDAALIAGCLLSASVGGFAQTHPPGPAHALVGPADVQWKTLRPGAEIAVVSGEPDKAGSPFVIRFRYRGKARIPPHWHPVDEHLTVLSGTFRIGMGERGDEAATTALSAGGYALLPAKMVHYAWADDNTIIQAHGVGPFAINYVNPADDPARGNPK